MTKIPLAIPATFAIHDPIPFPIYAGLAALTGLEPPSPETPGLFRLSVPVVKIGIAIGFVLLFRLARERWLDDWKTYAGLWWAMFAVMEVGQAIVPDYTWLDAGGGIVAEAIYFPLSALALVKIFRPPEGPADTV